MTTKRSAYMEASEREIDRLQQQIERLQVDRDAAKETGNVCHALHEEALAEVARLQEALLQIEERASRPGLDDHAARGEVWALVIDALAPTKAS
jgi:chromosome segregation ATPase